jgi:hypothetical protein
MKPNKGVRASETKDGWCTPERVRTPLGLFFNPLHLDPCSNRASKTGALIEWYGPPGGTNGLAMPWGSVPVDREPGELVRVFMNPPYSDKRAWARKAFDEWMTGGCEIIGLLPADTDTQWFHRYALKAPAMVFVEGRLTFEGDVSGPAMFPVVLPYWGPRPSAFLDAFGYLGWPVRNTR